MKFSQEEEELFETLKTTFQIKFWKCISFYTNNNFSGFFIIKVNFSNFLVKLTWNYPISFQLLQMSSPYIIFLCGGRLSSVIDMPKTWMNQNEMMQACLSFIVNSCEVFFYLTDHYITF
jgi:hypothetical protein